MNRTYFIVFFAWLIALPVFSQDEASWMKHSCKMVLDKVMNIEYSHTEGLIGDSVGFYSSEITGFKGIQGNLKSKDCSFLVFFRITNESNVSENGHITFVNSIVKTSFGNNADWKDYAHYYSSDNAKAKFNADTVISVSLLIDKERKRNWIFSENEYDINNYSNCTVLIIQKKGHGYLALYCFYDEDKKNKDLYMSKIERSLKYREGKPELENYNVDEIMVLWANPQQQKSEKVR